MIKKIILWITTISWAIYTFYLTTAPNFSSSPDTTLSWILSNGGHFFFFGVLAVLLYLIIKKPAIPFILTSLYGIFIEYLQLSIPGRSFSLEDWLLDILGSALFLVIIHRYENTRDWRRWIYRGNHR